MFRRVTVLDSLRCGKISPDSNETTIVFLGDYLNPYGSYDYDDILNNLADIIDYKRNNMERVILLLGNNDLH